MKTRVVLLRGINVGGKNPLPMKELVEVLEELGASGVRTYIQSGNAVCVGPEGEAASLSRRIRNAVSARYGFEPQVLVLVPADIETAIRENPFAEADGAPKSVHVGFLASVPANPDLRALEDLRSDSERFQLVGGFFFLHAPEGMARSKLAARAEKHLGVTTTFRNWKTVRALQGLAAEVA
jgi:uncharacterized protein (DUF1697 family)